MKLYDVINTNKYLYLVLEYINGISLLEFIQRKKKRRIEEDICKNIFHQIVEAILYCQNKNICHRDIKLENILIIKDNIIKLIDFGFAIKCDRDEYQEFFCGTLYYMPPEIVNKQKYIPFYSDIWSLGVLLYAMLFGKFPFKSNKEEKLFELINEAKLIFPSNIEVSDEAKNLLNKIIVIKPSKRISLEDILNDPWLKK
jgi:serine/threonine protein kinase